MKNFILDSDLSAIDGTLLVRAGRKVDKGLLEAIRAMAKRRRWKFYRVKETFLFKDLRRAFADERYKVIFAGPVARREILDVVKDARIEDGILLELKAQREKDPYTYYHMLIVAALTVKLTLTIRDKIKYNRFIALHTAFTHDLGKSRIPRKILEKTTPLTRNEFEALRTHPLIGYLLLNYYCVKNRDIYSLTALQHHEKANGKGYPRGIKRISKYTQLLQAVDILDALMTSRPYRKKPYNLRQALDFLISEANKRGLDRNVVLTLVSFARKTKPPVSGMKISRLWRERPPKDNVYGKVVD